MMVKVLVHKDKLRVAYKSAAYNLSLWIKARTEHACLKTSEFSNVHARLSPFLICSIAVEPSVLVLTAAPHTLPKRHKVCRHSDILTLMATELLLA